MLCDLKEFQQKSLPKHSHVRMGKKGLAKFLSPKLMDLDGSSNGVASASILKTFNLLKKSMGPAVRDVEILNKN